ncbi:MAG: hypothetical protein ACSLFQ_04740 [Thermoanaerobaculia bacterium]
MTRGLSIAFLALFILTAAAEKAVPPSWTDNLCLVEIEEGSGDISRIADEVLARGGGLGVKVSETHFLAWVPAGSEGSIRKVLGVKAIAKNQGEIAKFTAAGQIPENVVGFLTSNRGVARKPSQPTPRPKDDYPDVLLPPASSVLLEEDETLESLSLSRCRHTNCYMTGIVALAVFMVESSTSGGEDYYTWSTSDIAAVQSSATSTAMDLSYAASQWGKSLTIAVEFHQPITTGGVTADPAVFQPFEPITHNAYGPQDTALWIDPIMLAHGASSGSSVIDKVKFFNAGLRLRTGANHSVSAFVTYNPNPSTVYPGGVRGWSLLGGPFLHIVKEHVDARHLVLSHEVMHQFWACDEYASYCGVYFPGCQNCDWNSTTQTHIGPRGYLLNLNCEHASCNINAVSCNMRYLFEPYTVCEHTARQLGWIN